LGRHQGRGEGFAQTRDATHKMRPGDYAVAIAGQLTLEIRQMLRGENAPGAVKGFGRQLDYPASGVA
jgi:hypothetical protein